VASKTLLARLSSSTLRGEQETLGYNPRVSMPLRLIAALTLDVRPSRSFFARAEQLVHAVTSTGDLLVPSEPRERYSDGMDIFIRRCPASADHFVLDIFGAPFPGGIGITQDLQYGTSAASLLTSRPIPIYLCTGQIAHEPVTERQGLLHLGKFKCGKTVLLLESHDLILEIDGTGTKFFVILFLNRKSSEPFGNLVAGHVLH
jgi:hypothetical protein